MKIPVIDLGLCTDCEGCMTVCPAVFQFNQATDMLEVVEMNAYPEDCVNEAIKICPADCIAWEEH